MVCVSARSVGVIERWRCAAEVLENGVTFSCGLENVSLPGFVLVIVP